MKILKALEFLLIALILITFTSCGGSGGGVGGSGVKKPVVSKGTITGFGSVTVNGVEYETTGTTITTDENPNATQGDLDLGMVVTVRGTVNPDGFTGTADSIEFEDNLEGPITSANPTAHTIIVLGQTLVWDSSTICENKSDISINCATLAAGNLVEISGFPTISGTTTNILATRIELKDPVFDPAKDEVEVKGTISSLTTTTFLIGSQVVDFSAAVLKGVPNNTLANGMFVEAKGNLLSTGLLHATKIELEEAGLAVEENQEVEIEGLVDAFTSCNGSDCIFRVNGKPVQTNSATEFKNGAPSNIAVGVRLEVEGTIDANSVLIAREVSFHEARIEIEAQVQVVAPSNNTVTLLGSITVTATLLTGFEDNSSLNVKPFSLGNIKPGDFLRIRGRLDKGSIIADRIERRNLENRVLLQGPIDSVSNPNLVILGVTVQTDSKTQFEDINKGPITQAQFFVQVKPGMLVKAKGTFNGSAIIADEVEIED